MCAMAKKKKGVSRRDFVTSGAAAGVGAAVLSTSGTALAQTSPVTAVRWNYEADIVIIGAGCTGLPAAIRARDLGASVIVVDQNFDIGGKMLHSGGWVSLGGGDPLQKRDIAGQGDREGFVTAPPLQSAAELGWARFSMRDIAAPGEVLTLMADNSAFARAYGAHELPVCHIIRGLFCGALSGIVGPVVSARETQCLSTGADRCVFEFRTQASTTAGLTAAGSTAVDESLQRRAL